MAKPKVAQHHKPQAHTGEQHPEEYKADLNPHANEGQNIGLIGSHPEKSARTARDIKELHWRMRDLHDDDLAQIRVLPVGSRLEQGATYIDLNDPARREFTASGNMTAEVENYFVPKTEVPYQIWNRLLGVEYPERTGESKPS